MLMVAGTFRIPPEKLQGFKLHMAAMLAATRAEDGCLEYSYAEDVAEPGLVRVFETWRDQAALDAHFRTPHMAEWRAALAAVGVSDRRLFAYEVAQQRPI